MATQIIDEREPSSERYRHPDHEELWKAYFAERSIEARNALVMAYRPVVSMVVKMLPRNVRSYWDDDDLTSFGMFGLVDAISRWEPSARFETYAATRVRGAIFDELRRLDWLPRRVRRHVVVYNQASDELFGELGRTPRNTEVLAAAGLEAERDRAEAMEAVLSAQLLHIDHGMVYGVGDEVIELVSRNESEDPELNVVASDHMSELRRAVVRLPAQQRLVITLHLLAGLTQVQVAGLLGVSESRICQVAKAALRALRGELAEEALEAG
ncbi:MAG TPA: sigma-70 family RNA polymerase sigma factor [Acidimicrobiales bacterium]|nr:sigma-70 family RNA polymerase sigma factor [Acidimicrobiales bacterium]